MRALLTHRIATLAAALAAAGALAAADSILVAPFSSARPGGALPGGWSPLDVAGIERRTVYTLVEDGGVTVLNAEARASASGLSRELRADPGEYPVLRWRWKVANVLKSSDLRKKEGDDYPARLYVMFDYPIEKLPFVERTKLRLARLFYDPNLPGATLNYVWDTRAPAGTVAPSSYTGQVRLIVVESGDARVGRWVDYERDLVRDFERAFGEKPPAITAVAVATDTDNTGEAATAWFGDISLHRRAAGR